MKVVAFGEILWDVYPENAYIGGAPLNFAAHLARHGEEVHMLSAVGQDELGTVALARLAEWGVATDCVAVLEHRPTGQCLVILDAQSVPTYNLLENVAYDHIPGCPVADADVLYFGTLALRSDGNRRTLAKLLEAGIPEVFVDVNIRSPFYTPETVAFAVEHATILKISEEEWQTVSDLLAIPAKDGVDFVQMLAAAYPRLRCIVLTLGPRGAYAWQRSDGTACTCGAAPAEVVSTVGAGDSFSAAFLHGYLQGDALSACLAYAVRIAGFVVAHTEAVPTYRVEDFR